MATQPSQGVAFRKNGEELSRATSGMSVSNYPTIYGGFIQKGIPESEIKPRENVFTYSAWRALGRQVRRGEHGVRVLTFIDCQRKDEETGQHCYAITDEMGVSPELAEGNFPIPVGACTR